MSYVDGFVAAVPATNKEIYRKHAAEAAPLFRRLGATRLVETWGDDVPHGTITDFRGAVKAEPDEVVVFSFIEYPDKATRDRANERMTSDPAMNEMAGKMPFDARRMIYGGFAPLVDVHVDAGARGPMSYVDGSLLAVPAVHEQTYRDMAARMAPVFLENGASRVVDAWESDVPSGKITDFKRAVKATDDERVVFSFIEWPSKDARVEGWRRAVADPRMQQGSAPSFFDGKRWVHGGFATLVDA